MGWLSSLFTRQGHRPKAEERPRRGKPLSEIYGRSDTIPSDAADELEARGRARIEQSVLIEDTKTRIYRRRGTLIAGFDPEWMDEFPGFPVTLAGRMALDQRDSDSLPHRYVVTLGEDGMQFASGVVSQANDLLAKALSLHPLPPMTLAIPEFANDFDSLPPHDSIVIRCQPFTKTGRMSKFPFVLELEEHVSFGPDVLMQMKAALWPDGRVGRIDIGRGVMPERPGGPVGFPDWWLVACRERSGGLSVSSISSPNQNGPGQKVVYRAP